MSDVSFIDCNCMIGAAKIYLIRSLSEEYRKAEVDRKSANEAMTG